MPPSATLSACSFQPGPGLLNGQIPLHLRQAGHDMEKETAGRHGGINLVGQRFEENAVKKIIESSSDED